VGKEFELIIVLFQAVHFELEARTSVDECPGLILALWEGSFDAAPDSAMMKLGVEESRRLLVEYGPFQ
jgi:hypothetical protein